MLFSFMLFSFLFFFFIKDEKSSKFDLKIKLNIGLYFHGWLYCYEIVLNFDLRFKRLSLSLWGDWV